VAETGDEEEGGRVIFARKKRTLAATQRTTLISVGVDIGSSTTHLVFSHVRMELKDGRYVVGDRAVVYESDILLTPYSDEDTIDAQALDLFVRTEYAAAGITPERIDTGALVMTGVAARRANARAIGELFAVETGKFVSVAAGDRVEAAMTAFGSGAAANSGATGAVVMNIDIGGGTTKFAVCAEGAIADLTAVDIGARLVALDEAGNVARIEEAGKHFADACGVTLTVGAPPPEGAFAAMAENMADRLMEIILPGALSPATEALLRLPAMAWDGPVHAVTISGGVSEYIYGYERQDHGDLGPLLAAAVKSRIEAAGLRLMEPVEGIRATVVGASQYTIQLSGNTIHVAPEDTLPLRNVPVVKPGYDLSGETLDSETIAAETLAALTRMELTDGEKPVAVCFAWRGSATFGRTDAFVHGVVKGLAPVLAQGHPLLLVCEGDIGRTLGLHATEAHDLAVPVVSIDGVALEAFDFIDIGALIPESGAVPVVIKSLLFPASTALGREGSG
jgi:ethanolamine utilization protein EutA